MTVPNVKPISELRNYTEVLKEVKPNQRVNRKQLPADRIQTLKVLFT